MTQKVKNRKPRANSGGIYLTAHDLAILMGTKRMNTAWARHKEIRNAIKPGKVSLTVREYCDFEGDDYEEVLRALGREK